MKPFGKGEWREMERSQIKALAKSAGTSMNQIEKGLRDIRENEEVYLNDQYQVNVRRIKSPFGDLFWLSIKRLDKEVIHDWRDLQEIKNLIVGPENEGVELYPAEARKVDTSNQYHLFVLADSTKWWPFGFADTKVLDGTGEIGKDNTRQRPLKEKKDG